MTPDPSAGQCYPASSAHRSWVRPTPKREQKGTHRNKFDPEPVKPLDDPTLSDAARAIIGMRSRFQQLKPHHHLAIELLIRGLNDREVAEQIGRDRSRITKWRNYNPYFRAELARRRQEVFGSFADNLRFTLGTCLEELQSQLKHEDLNVRNRAANQIINHAKHKGFQPPPEPTDPAALMAQLARQKKIELHLQDNPFYGPLEEDDFLNAMEDLDEKARNYPLDRDQHPEDTPDSEPLAPSPRTRGQGRGEGSPGKQKASLRASAPSASGADISVRHGYASPSSVSCSPSKSDRSQKHHPPQHPTPSRLHPSQRAPSGGGI